MPLLALTACATHTPALSESPASTTQTHRQGVSASTSAPVVYPTSRRDEVVEDYHGVKVADPYRWLEDMDGADTRAWIEAQNRLTFAQLERIDARSALADRLRALWDFERWGVPRYVGTHLVASRNDGLQNQSVVYVLGSKDERRVLIDPNTLSADGTVALAGIEFSHDGTKCAYGLADAGSDWQVWKVRDVATGEDLPDRIQWVKFTDPTWAPDNQGLYYARYDAPAAGEALSGQNRDQKVYYHRLGEPQQADQLVYAEPTQPRWGFDPVVTEDGRWLVLTVRIGTDPKTSILVQRLKDGRVTGPMRKILPGFTARFKFIGSQEDVLWLLTDDAASRGRLIAVDVRKPGRKAWKTLIPESARTLTDVSAVGGRFVATWLENAQSKVTVVGLDGTSMGEVDLPGIGTVGGFTGKLGDPDTYFSFTGFATPPEIWKLDPASLKATLWRRPKVDFDLTRYRTEQVFYASEDGTQIPMFLTYRKDVKFDGERPTYLYGYGGFNIPLTPNFSVPNLVWMEMGGVYAVPNLRGGGEFGEAWHAAGTKVHKQNVFDDFVAAAHYLIDHQITRPDKLAIGGRSNGGLLVGAVLTQHPELFGAALPGVGVMDMLRFNKFTIGEAWESDYGSPQDPDQFAALYAYSPVHNARDGRYPATLIYTADHDDRVVPAHSYKFAAALQHAQHDEAPILIRIDTKAGHGAGKPTTKQIEEWADLWGFLVAHLQVDLPSAKAPSQGQ